MKEPKVSFIIPYYNSGLTIDETISSIQNQSYKHFDIWLIDDGSTDAFSIKKIEEFKNIENITILHIPNSGPGIARNIAIEKTNSEFIVPLDADDLIESNSISEAVIKMNDNNKIGAVFGNIRLFGNESKIKIQSFRDMKTQLIYNQLAITALIRKQVFETVGYYDEFLSKPGLEDWEFWIRFSNSEWDFDQISTIFLSVRVNQLANVFLRHLLSIHGMTLLPFPDFQH